MKIPYLCYICAEAYMSETFAADIPIGVDICLFRQLKRVSCFQFAKYIESSMLETKTKSASHTS